MQYWWIDDDDDDDVGDGDGDDDGDDAIAFHVWRHPVDKFSQISFGQAFFLDVDPN